MLKSIKPDNVPQSFARILPDGEHVEYVHLPYYANLAVDHVQGLTKTCIDGKAFIADGEPESLFPNSGNFVYWLQHEIFFLAGITCLIQIYGQNVRWYDRKA